MSGREEATVGRADKADATASKSPESPVGPDPVALETFITVHDQGILL
jgi:hypothetical protein